MCGGKAARAVIFFPYVSRISRRRTRICAVVGVLTIACVLASEGSRAADSKPAKAVAPNELPPFSVIEQIVRRHFADKHYGDKTLISQGDVAPLFPRFVKAGWQVADRDQIIGDVLPDNDFMVQQLRTPQGRAFAAQIARYPEGYDRADRLRLLPRGERFLSDMVRGPDGYKLIQYMDMTPGGQYLGVQLSRIPEGRDFNKPTGRIYTCPQLIQRLRQSYQAEREKRKQAAAATVIVE
jgi:hypothetical protein